MQSFSNKDGIRVIYVMIDVIQKNKDYLSEIDGLIGDGDHGINMNKGFAKCKEKLEGKVGESLATGLKILGKTLVTDIGGSMGPLYSAFFIGMSQAAADKDRIDARVFGAMLENGVDSVKNIGGAKAGDKTMIDTLEPALNAYQMKLSGGADFKSTLGAMKDAAIAGKDSTKDMVAKMGRASRLGERSRGVPDAGATSCCLLICAMSDAIRELVS